MAEMQVRRSIQAALSLSILAAASQPVLADGADGALVSVAKAVGSESGGKFRMASPGYIAKTEYQAPMDNVFRAAMNVFDDNQINTAVMDESLGRITTDYIPGPTRTYLGGLWGSTYLRYKYNLVLRDGQPGTSRLSIRATVEHSSDSNPTWHDVSKDDAESLKSLEGWLYEQIQREVEKTSAPVAAVPAPVTAAPAPATPAPTAAK